MSNLVMSNIQPSPLVSPFLGQPVEICIVTADLRQTLAGLVQLGIGPFKIYHFSPKTVLEQTIRGEKHAFEIRVAFAEQGRMIWEVMQPVSGPTAMQEFLDSTNGRGGIHHVAFDCMEGEPAEAHDRARTGDAARAEAVRRRLEFEQRGFGLVQSGVWHGKKGTCEFMFFDTEGAVNTCFETYVFSDDWQDPEDVEHHPPKPKSVREEAGS